MTGSSNLAITFFIGNYHQSSWATRQEPKPVCFALVIVCQFQLSSYGGYLEFTLRFVPRPGEEEQSDGEALVELSVCSEFKNVNT